MKSFILPLFLTVLLVSCGGDDSESEDASEPATNKNDVEETPVVDEAAQWMSEIDEVVSDWETHDFDTVMRTYSCPDYPEDGEAFYLTEGTTLSKIVNHFTDGSHAEGTVTYYLQDGQLFFAEESMSTWYFTSDGSEEGVTEDHLITTLHYFHEGEIFHCLRQSSVSFSDSDNAPAVEEQDLDDCGNDDDILEHLAALKWLNDQYANIEGQCVFELFEDQQ